MTLKAKEDLAMVLPLPVQAGSGERAVTFIDLKTYAAFFTDLRSGFPMPHSLSASLASRGDAPAKLKLALTGWIESSRPANAFIKTGDAKGLIDGERHCSMTLLHGDLPNRDTLLRRV